MRREIVRNRAGRVLGSYEDNRVSDRIDARDAGGRWLGFYDKRLDETRDATGRLLARGNVLPSLIFHP
jgi:hypothetical protein